jgi:hypothetical protein
MSKHPANIEMQALAIYNENKSSYSQEFSPMAFIKVPNCVFVRIRLVTAVAGLEATIGLWFQKTNFIQDDMQDLADHLEANFVADLMTPLCDDYTANLISVYDMTDVEGLVVHKEIDIDGGSTPTDTPLSPANCLVVSFYGDKRGKWNQGRNYVAGLTEQGSDQVDVGQTTADDILAAYQTLIDDPPTGWTWCVVSRYFDKQPRVEGVANPVNSVIYRNRRFGFQRRRARRG